MTGAVIEDVLFTPGSVSKRVVVFPQDLGVAIPCGGSLVGEGKAAPYTGPITAYGPEWVHRPAVIVSGGDETDHFRPGVSVTFAPPA